MSSTAAEQDDRRRRRRVVVFLSVGLITALVLASVGVFSLDQRGGAKSGPLDGGGSGTAPVLVDPPADLARPAAPEVPTGPTARPDPTGAEVVTAHGGGSLVAFPDATRGAALGAPRTHGVNLVLTSKLSAPLRPGRERALYVTVRNPNPFAVDLFRVDVRVDPPPVVGCLTEWVKTGRYRFGGGTPRRIAGGTSAVVNLPIELVDLVDVDQNACQGTYFPLRLSGVAVDVE